MNRRRFDTLELMRHAELLMDRYNSTEGMTEAEMLGYLQGAIRAAIGGGMLADFAVRQPADFYIDMRVGKLPYCRTKIMNLVGIYQHVARMMGRDPHNMAWHGADGFHLGIF